MTDLRGVMVPIIDLRLKLGLDDVKYDCQTVVIVLNVIDRIVEARYVNGLVRPFSLGRLVL